MPDRPQGVDRLMAALAAQQAWEENPDGDLQGFLVQHEELRDLLEPMLKAPEESATPDEWTLGVYRVQRELGRGGMGVVYQAWHPELRREVALKVLPAHQTLNLRAVARFRREASAMARLEHPGIVSVFDVGEEGEHHFFAMELLRGRPVDVLLAEREDSGGARDGWYRRVVDWGVQMAAALAYAHSRGVLHRDVKPANIMVEPDDRVVLMDFGLARLDELGGPGLTVEGQYAGTPHYSSPEQAAGRWEEVGAPSDVFSLGATLYEMLALRRPFDGPTTHAVLDAITRKEPEALENVAAGVPRDLAAVVHKTLAKDPLARYPSAEELRNDLQAVLDRRPVTARHATAVQRTVRWARREPIKAALVGVLALGAPVLTGLVGYVYANAENVAAGEAALHTKAVEERLDRGYAALHGGSLGEAYQIFEALVVENGELDEALAGELLVLGEILDPAPLRSWARSWATALDESPVLRHVCNSLMAGDTAPRDWLGQREGWTATDCFVAASYCLARGRLDRDAKLLEGAAYLYRQASLTSPRLHHLCALARATAALDDQLLLNEAVETLERLFPDRLPALLTVSEVLRDRQPERALTVARSAVARNPEDPDLQANLAAVEWTTGRREEAETRFAKVLDRFPDHRLALGGLARAARARGDLDGARALLEKALASIEIALPRVEPFDPASREVLGTAVIHAAPRTDLSLDLVEVLAHQGEMGQAMQILSRTRGALPAFDEPVAGVAQALFHASRRGAAREILEPFVSAGSEDALSLLVWAKICNEDEDYEAALQASEKVASLRPDDPQVHVVRATVLYNLGQLSDAMAVLRSAIERNPTSEMLSGLLREVCALEGNEQGALVEAERLADALFTAGEPRRAADVLEPYLESAPEAFRPRLRAALARYRQAVGR